MNTANVVSKKPHWFTNYRENLIKNMEIEEKRKKENIKKEKNETRREKYALNILNKLPEDLLPMCLEFLDENFKKKIYLTKITNLFKKYVGNLDILNSHKYEKYPIYLLMEKIPQQELIRFIKSGTPSKYYTKIYNNSLFYDDIDNKSLFKTLVERYKGYNNLSSHVCAWEITKIVAFLFDILIVEREDLYNNDFKEYKEYDLHFKKYERYAVRMINSIVYLHEKYKNKTFIPVKI